MAKSKVYIIRKVEPESLIKVYEALGIKLEGKVAVKLHSGEKGNKNYLKPEFVKPIVNYINGVVVECNTAYEGARNYSDKHLKLLDEHGWTDTFKVDLLDEYGYIAFEIPNGKIIKENYVGRDILKYDSCLVLSHFKGHAMGGYGGALKQLSIGFASSEGKTWIHTAGKTTDQTILFDNLPEQDRFLEAMADAASSVHKHFNGKIAYINCMVNISKDCDCDGEAAPPCMKDIGILASLDPVAIDRACMDLVENSDDNGKNILLERVNSLNGIHTIDASALLGFGNKDYELIEIE